MIQRLAASKFDSSAPADHLPQVLLVVDQFPKVLGGGERIVLRLASLLPEYGFRASILTFFVHPESNLGEALPCPVYLLPLQKTYDLNAFKAALHLQRFLQDQNIQIVQTFFESSDIWAGGVSKLLADTKVIWSRRDLGILRTGKHKLAYRLLAGMPDAVFAVSEQVREHCIQIDGIDPARVYTIYNGLDLAAELPRPARPEQQAPLIVTVGNIRRVKGHDILIHAAASINRSFPEARFSIAGSVLEADYFEELKGLIGSLGLSDRFEFAGNITDLPSYLSSADIFVLPSRSEGFSNALIEAMASALPVVATDVGGNGEAIEEGISGFLVPPESPEKLSDALVRLLSDPTLARSMGNAGQSIAARKFTTEAMMRKTVTVYKEILADL